MRGAIRTRALRRRSEIEDHSDRPPEQATVKIDRGPSRCRCPHRRRVGATLSDRREVAVVAHFDERASDGGID